MKRLHHALLAASTVLLLLAGSCSEQMQDAITPTDAATSLSKQQDNDGLARALAAKERHVTRLLNTDAIVGAGVGRTEGGTPALLVFTTHAQGTKLPAFLDGVPVVENVSGPIVAYQATPQVKPPKPGTSIDPKAWFTRAVPIGVSTSNITDVCAAGTIGCRVKIGGTHYLLSNNHVLAKERSSDGTSSSEGIVQPGRYDDGCAINTSNVIATLSRWKGISPTGNYIDAAVAETNTGLLSNSTPANGYGVPSSSIVQTPALGSYVLKYGRTTGQTRGKIIGVNITLRVQYSAFVAEFEDQIAIDPVKGGAFSKAGDSGSLIVLDESPYNPVGLLFAGGARTTFANKISRVLAEFNATIE